ncbi:cobaltochelatase subunit CobN [Oscillatoria sp. CS-180]|uniref:cobaltochelatase subunit CobN n=1 Tax=Oscillatoria sp. CS-180 TaxID=3021720 RepID=UPI002330F9AA|nr:cobaltochelatase subunit CobN [Oscillatoria sp. CS-180]MDB9526832.1 cobaltochelatase subunit CobN [Oscillatoria sp. CS-180]
MHRLAATTGGWTPDTDGVIFVEQTPASIIFMTAADTDIQCLSQIIFQQPESMPKLRVVNLLQLQQQLAIDTYADTVLVHASVIVLRLLGGRAYWSYGLEVTKAVAEAQGIALIVLPGDDRPDPDLMGHSTVPLRVANTLWRYLTEGGIDNIRHGLMEICDRYLQTQFSPPGPQPLPRVGLDARWNVSSHLENKSTDLPRVGILFYRAHALAGNTAPIKALCVALEERGLMPVPIYVSSLQDEEVQAELVSLLKAQGESGVRLLLNTTSFSVAKLNSTQPCLDLWQQLNVPVLQVILSGGTQDNWQQNSMGLSPRDIAMNVALPEVDGRIITRAVSFKTVTARNEQIEADVVTYAPVRDRVEWVADLAANWITLQQTPTAHRRVALVLANYPNRDGRLANGVGLDTPQSCIELLKALQTNGYSVPGIPATGEDLIDQLTQTVTNDLESQGMRQVRQSLSMADYQAFYKTLPLTVQQEVQARWGTPEEERSRQPMSQSRLADSWPIAGFSLGNIFVGIQPSRGYDQDPSLNYHAPDLEPTHAYLAFYGWLRHRFQAHAIIHMGKHGNLEWLPGKGIGLSQDCYPEAVFGPIPHLYPFIVNDPGEGAQAKRRAQAVIVDHLTPPLTRAELYGPLQRLEGLVDEYYEAQSLDPTRLAPIRDRILTLLQETQLLTDLTLENDASEPSPTDETFANLLPTVDGYLCELKEAQIRDGLHIFGQCPQGRQLRDLMVAIARHPSSKRLGLTRAIAQDWQLNIDPLTDDLGQQWTLTEQRPAIAKAGDLYRCRTVGDVVEVLENQAASWVETTLQDQPFVPALTSADYPATLQELSWIREYLLPTLRQTPQEIQAVLAGLNGQYVPSGPAGAPTRNRPDVLPTGRNFYSVDIRAIPTESAWDVGRQAAELLVERYTQDNGDYPQAIGLSVWGTSTMRTGGDDLAEALALLGVRPVWDGPSRRVVDFEVLPISVLGRPRVDVTLRVSGFFRDAFPNLIDLFDQAVTAVSQLLEAPEDNPLAAKVASEIQHWQMQGLEPEQAAERSRYRVFGSKPGAYGAGLQGLIEAQNWTDDRDLAQAYINWSSYAYGRQAQGRSAPEAFEARLQTLQVVLHNQDNREHDLLDSDDYYQFQGGLTAAVRKVSGRSPQVYFGDHSVIENPKVRSLQQEIARVYRSRVVNPKWITGVKRHGYKGAFEMAATVDYLFAYDATTQCVADYMYEGVAAAYLLNEATRQFVQRSNPWALRDMAERLLEAHQRQFWQRASTDTLNILREIVHAAEADIESRQDSTIG